MHSVGPSKPKSKLVKSSRQNLKSNPRLLRNGSSTPKRKLHIASKNAIDSNSTQISSSFEVTTQSTPTVSNPVTISSSHVATVITTQQLNDNAIDLSNDNSLTNSSLQHSSSLSTQSSTIPSHMKPIKMKFKTIRYKNIAQQQLQQLSTRIRQRLASLSSKIHYQQSPSFSTTSHISTHNNNKHHSTILQQFSTSTTTQSLSTTLFSTSQKQMKSTQRIINKANSRQNFKLQQPKRTIITKQHHSLLSTSMQDNNNTTTRTTTNLLQPTTTTTSTNNVLSFDNILTPFHQQKRFFAAKRTSKATNNDDDSDDDIPATTKKGNTVPKKGTKKALDDDEVGAQYQRMSQREHILLRPEPYLGSPECVTDRLWVLTKPLTDGEDVQVVDVDFNFIPGLYKIFDEILVNAADNVHRNSNQTKMTYMDIKIDPITNLFSIENDGASIPIVKHPKEPMYVPELIFGHLLTSSNYDDTVARFTGGRHGFGAKLTNIFSQRFIVTIGDTERGLIYRQEFHKNMSEIQPGILIDTTTGTCTNTLGQKVDPNTNPTLKYAVKSLLAKNSKSSTTNFTRIEFYPDLPRFQVDRLTFLPTGGSIQDDSASNATEKAKRAIQKKQLNEVLTSDKIASQQETISSTSTDNNFAITLHKSPELNQLLQKDPHACFPPFLLPLFERRILDIAALMGNFSVDVTYNGKKLKTNTYTKYLQKCPSFPQPDPAQIAAKKAAKKAAASKSADDDDDDELIDEDDQDKLTGTVVTTFLDKHWFIGVSQRPQYHNTNSGSQSLSQLSFVNGVATTRGGSHVSYVQDIIARYIVTYLNSPARKKRWGLEQDVTIGLVKQFMCVFVSCYIHNPSFDTQTKDALITHIKGAQTQNQSKSATIIAPVVPESFLKSVCSQTGIIQNIALSLQQRQHKQLQRKLDGPGRRTARSGGLAIEKLDDALWAGTERSGECTLILTEGDSAKALAVSGLSVLGRERFGVYPLKGKLLNVRDASKTSIANNKELVEIMQILGLKLTGNDRSHLRYGSVLVMADQDHDGSHIKGLLMNALHMLCPDLVKQQIHEVSTEKQIHKHGSNAPRVITDGLKEVMEQPYESNIPDNLKLNTSQHQFVRLFVTPIVKATYTGSDYPILSLQRNLNYQQDLLEFQSKYGHLTPKQIDQLNATRKMLYQSRKDGERAIDGDATQQKKKKSTTSKTNDDDGSDVEIISPPEQYNTSLSFGKEPQDDGEHHHTTTTTTTTTTKGKRGKADDGAVGPIKKVNDAITIRGKVISFYSQFAYKQWWDKLSPSLQKKFKCKYYKGLGTSTSAEGKEYFSDLPSHIIDLLHRTRHDDQSLNLAFAKDHVDQRKSWVMENSHIPPSDEYIRTYNKKHAYSSPSPPSLSSQSRYSQTKQHQIEQKFLASRYTTINEFIHNELVQFSVADTIRSLPSTLDGFKPSQRKITYAALTKPLNNELRVSQFSAYVAERLVYHHGEQSLTAAIVNLAQDYPGTNNIPLLTGVGQFGTRHTGGKDHASARYIYTKTGPLTQELFPSADFAVLPQQTEEGTVIEPIHLLPILPLMIINGSSGIGTGFSTDIPPHNPLHVFQAVVQWLNNEPMRLIAPFNVGMSAQLYPITVHKFQQNSYELKLPTINDVNLSQEVQIPDIDAPWEVIPLHDTTDINKTYPYDTSYGVNEAVQFGIDGRVPSQVYQSNELISSLTQFTIDNKPIITPQSRSLQLKGKKYLLDNPLYDDDAFIGDVLGPPISGEASSALKLKEAKLNKDKNGGVNKKGKKSKKDDDNDDGSDDAEDVDKLLSELSSEDDNTATDTGSEIEELSSEPDDDSSSSSEDGEGGNNSDLSSDTSEDDDNNNSSSSDDEQPQIKPKVVPPTQSTKTTTTKQIPKPTITPPIPKAMKLPTEAPKPRIPLSTPIQTNGPPKTPQERIAELSARLAMIKQQSQSKKPIVEPENDNDDNDNESSESSEDSPELINQTTTSHTVNTTSKSSNHNPQMGLDNNLINRSYLTRSDIAVSKWVSHGKYFLDANSKRTLHIVELPVGMTTAAYKKFLISLLSTNRDDSSSPNDIILERIEERHTEQHVWFTIHCQQNSIQDATHEDFISKLRLTANISLSNMHGFGANNNLHGFSDVRIPLAEYCVERLKCYERRRAVQITEKWRQLRLSSNISRFCTMIMSGKLTLTNKSKLELLQELQKHGFDKYSSIYPKDTPILTNGAIAEPDVPEQSTTSGGKKGRQNKVKQSLSSSTTNAAQDMMNNLSDFEDDDDNTNPEMATTTNHTEQTISPTDNGYDYLLKIPMVSATKEKVKQLEKQMVSLQSQVASLVHTTAKQMWLHELSILQPKLEAYIKQRHEQAYKHPFTSTHSYKAALDGTSMLPFSYEVGKKPSATNIQGASVRRTRATGGAAAKKAAGGKKSTKAKAAPKAKAKATPAKRTTKAAGTSTTTKAKKATTTTKKPATRKKTTSGATMNEPLIFYKSSTIINKNNNNNKTSVIPQEYHDNTFFTPNKF